MKKIFLISCIFILTKNCFSQTIMFNPLTNNMYSYKNSNNFKNTFQKTNNGYLYYPLNNLPQKQNNGYTLQNTQPYVGQYYFNPEYWLLKW